MSELEIFNNEEFGQVRSIEVEGEPYFVAKDIAIALGYSNPRKAIIDHVDEEDKGVTKCDTLGGAQEITIINESGLYSLILSSKLPSAKEFKRWITSDVLPKIRKTGGYINNDDLFINTYLPFADDTTKLLFKSTLQVINNQNKLIEEQKPLVTFANTVANSSDTIDMGEMAKLCSKEGLKIGRNRLFETLREQKILMSNNNPYQSYVERKWFEIIETVKHTSYGDKLFTKTMVTGLGQIKIIEKLKENRLKNE